MREIQSLARGLQIIDLLINAPEALSVTELADKLDVDKSTASRLVGTLQKYGYVQQAPHSRACIPGKRLHSIGLQLSNRYALRELAMPYLHDLVHKTSECAHIGVYSSGKALVTDDIQSENSLLRVVGNTGRLIHLHNTAVGKGLIAFGDFPLPHDLPQVTRCTITSHEELISQLETVRTQGYAVDNEENEYGVCCIASPVFNAVGITIAAIGISGPSVRVTEDQFDTLGQLVRQAAQQLSVDLGYEGVFPG